MLKTKKPHLSINDRVQQNLKSMIAARNYTVQSVSTELINYVFISRPLETKQSIQSLVTMTEPPRTNRRKNKKKTEGTEVVEADPDRQNGKSGQVKIILRAKTPNGDNMCCIMHESDCKTKLGIGSIRRYLPFLKDHHFQHVILLTNVGATPQSIETARKSKIYCEFFDFSALSYIPVNYFKVPTTRRIDPSLVPALLQHLKIESGNQLPKLNRDDVVRVYYDYRPGDIIEAKTSSKENGSYISYNYVTDN